MKRSLSLILTVVMLFTFVIPASANGGYDKELENAIVKAKSVFNISDEYDKFEYYINSYSSNLEFTLRWYDSTEKIGGINVTIDYDGMIRSYHKYNYNVQREGNTLPKISKEEGLEIANNFLKKVVPELVDKLMYENNNNPLSLFSNTNYYNYHRIENGVPFYSNGAYVYVDNMTGEVQSFHCTWDKNVKFDTKDGIIDLESAKKAYADKIGLKLVYKLDYSNNEITPYVVYTSLYSGKSIDAKTGEPVGYYDIIRHGVNETATKDMATSNVSGEVILSPEELDAISKVKDIISKEEAEKTARQLLQINSELTLNSIHLYSTWNSRDSFMWSMYFTNTVGNSIYVSIDARNKELLSFHKYLPSLENEVKYDREQLQKKAEEFIKKVQKDKFNLVELVDGSEPIVRPLTDELPIQQHFTFIRKVGNAYFQGNGFNLYLDTRTGEVVSYDYNWYKGQLPSVNKAIGLDKAYEILFARIGMELQYVKENNVLYYDELEKEQNTKLIYTIKNDKPLNIDAFTGELIYGLNRPYKDNTIPQYTDIEDSYAKTQIETLAKYGIGFLGDKFNPKANIKQKEFLYLLLKARSNYYDISEQDKDFIEVLYQYMISEKIVKENEKSPESIITKEEAAKYIVRALGYEKVANIEGIYKLRFNDASKISPELVGYVAIATGLGVVEAGKSNDNFNPKANMTREQAAVVIYNLLNAK